MCAPPPAELSRAWRLPPPKPALDPSVVDVAPAITAARARVASLRGAGSACLHCSCALQVRRQPHCTHPQPWPYMALLVLEEPRQRSWLCARRSCSIKNHDVTAGAQRRVPCIRQALQRLLKQHIIAFGPVLPFPHSNMTHPWREIVNRGVCAVVLALE